MEQAFEAKFPGMKGNLATKIDKLVQEGKLSADLGDWAHEVRLIGNEGAHDPEVNREDLTALREFTDAVLRYAISLPAEIATRRAAVQPAPS